MRIPHFKKPKPIVGEIYKFSNKKHSNPHSGQVCTVLKVATGITNHNALVECEDGYKVLTSKWNLFEIKVKEE